MPDALSSCLIADFTQYLAGPYCTMQLADFGADVIKVERAEGGDESRRMTPIVDGQSYAFQQPNRNKRSLAVDLKTKGGREVVQRLLARADVVVENFRPGVAARLGIGYEDVSKVNARAIYCSISGFGQTGPLRQRAGFDIIAQGMSGLLSMTGNPDGEPAKVGVAINDLVAGMTATSAILAAYIHRLRSNEGQYIDVSLLESGLALTVWEAGAYFGMKEVAKANGTRHRQYAPYQAFRTEDGYITVGANSDHLWRLFCTDVVRRPEWVEQSEYASISARVQNVDQLEEDITTVLSKASSAYWVAQLEAAGVPGGPVLQYDDALNQEQVSARGMIKEVVHPRLGSVRLLAPPAKMSRTPGEVRTAAPLLGQHTCEILEELGYDKDHVEELLFTSIVYQEV